MMQSGNKPIDRKCVVVTGASSGIGKATAEIFVREGWHVIGVGRDKHRCEEAERQLKAMATPGGQVDFLRGDFTEMADVRCIASDIAALTDRIDILVNNAGGVRDGHYRTSEGLEATFAANHMATFLLTNDLLPLLTHTPDLSSHKSRVITVSSSAHTHCPGMKWGDLMMEEDFSSGAAYCQAKLANLLFSHELDRRYRASGIVALAMHPGKVGSNFANHGDNALQTYMASVDLDPPEQPARTIFWLATTEDADNLGGRYFFEMKEEDPAAPGKDPIAAQRLWAETQLILEGTGVNLHAET